MRVLQLHYHTFVPLQSYLVTSALTLKNTKTFDTLPFSSGGIHFYDFH